jgi:hypothetical protein
MITIEKKCPGEIIQKTLMLSGASLRRWGISMGMTV